MDISMLVPDLAARLGVAPSTLVFFLFLLNVLARAAARSIPDDATGGWAFLRQVCAILGVEVPSKVTSGVTVNDVAASALKTSVADKPPVADKINEEK